MPERTKTTKTEVDALTSTISSLATTVSTLTRTVNTLAGNPPSPRTDAQRFERRGTSEASTNVQDISAEASAALAEMNTPEVKTPDVPGHTGLGHALEAYAKYLALFVGAGLISGSIVHFPLDPTRYTIVGIIGGVLFSGASALGDIRTNGLSRSTIWIVAASLVLSLGIGMISGGIQHFEDFPARAALLIPFGIVVSVAAFIIRQSYRMTGQHLLWLAAGGFWVVMIIAFGLHALASGPASSSETSGHSHGETTETTAITTQSVSPKAAQPASNAGSSTPTTAAAQHDADGHGH